MTCYIAITRQESVTGYCIRFPDFPECMLIGESLIEARDMAKDVLGFHVVGMIEDGFPVPDPSTFEAIMADPKHNDGVAMLVPLVA